jgi:hypothetical protein
MPSPEDPLTGACACGTVRFAITAPFDTAGYCHCTRCQRRSGTLWSISAMVRSSGFRIVEGREAVRTWRPAGGNPKSFCVHCGGHVFSGELDGEGDIGVRLGAVDGDPGIEPSWRQWMESVPDWHDVPDDGLPRFPRSRDAGT